MRTRGLRFEGLEDRRVLAVFHLIADVDDGAVGSLRKAVAIANRNQEDDVIHLSSGKYDLSLVGSAEDASASGDLDFTEAGTTVTLIGAGAGQSIIDAAQLSDRAMDVFGGAKLTLQGLSIRNGSQVAQGGGIRSAGTLEIRDSEVSSNASDLGGGIYNVGGNLIVRNSKLHGNVASDGGAILNLDGQATIDDSEIRDNSATGSRGEVRAKPIVVGGIGGGLLNVSGSVTVNDSAIIGNVAKLYGGGFGSAGGSMQVVDTSVSKNSATSGAGAATLFAIDGEAAMTSHFRFPAESGSLEIRRSIFAENRATADGGGVRTTGGSQVDILGSTFTGNQAGVPGDTFRGAGGALALYGGGAVIRILDSTITENSAQLGGGIAHGLFPNIHVGSSIVAGNHDLDTGTYVDVDGEGSFVSEGNNLIGSVSSKVTGFIDGVQNDRVGGNGNPPINALLEPLLENGVPTGIHVPTTCSPAIALGAGAHQSVDVGTSALNCHGEAVADWFTLADGDFVLPITSNDESEDGPPVITWVDEPSHGGKLSISADQRSVHYAPADGFQGLETFAYAIEGSGGELQHAVVSVDVIAAPPPSIDEVVVQRDSVDNEFNVLINDSGLDGFEVGLLVGVKPIIEVTDSEAGGTVEIAADGRSIRYSPAAGFVGVDKFEYTLVGGRSAHVRIRVYDPATALQASDHHFTVLGTADNAGSVCDPTADQHCRIFGIQGGWNLPVLENRTHGSIAGDLLTIESVGVPDQGGYAGIIRRVSDQWIQYRPRAGFTGVETIEYVTRDLEGRTSTGTITVNVIRLEDLARIRLEATDAAGNVIESVHAGQPFHLRVMAQDLRPDNPVVNGLAALRSGFWSADGKMRAVQGASVRVGFNSELISAAGDVKFGAPYADSALDSNKPIAQLSGDGIELAASADWIREIGSQDFMFATIPLVAKTSGPIEFTLEPAGGVSLFLLSQVPNYAVDYQGISLDVLSSGQNPSLREDVNNDGVLTPRDALVLINDLNENGGRQLFSGEGETGAAESSSYYPDVNSDGWLTPGDVVVIFNRLNQAAQSGSAEGEAVDLALSAQGSDWRDASDSAQFVLGNVHFELEVSNSRTNGSNGSTDTDANRNGNQDSTSQAARSSPTSSGTAQDVRSESSESFSRTLSEESDPNRTESSEQSEELLDLLAEGLLHANHRHA